MTIRVAPLAVQGSPVAGPLDGTLLSGALRGCTRPYGRPWDIAPLRAANEPAKPPLSRDSNRGK